MIHDHDRVSIAVTADGSAVHADISVSLGLIVTELVINALKHAFPGDRGGKILVDYNSNGSDWALSVSDNGVGTPERSEEHTSELQSLMRISYAVFCLKKKTRQQHKKNDTRYVRK